MRKYELVIEYIIQRVQAGNLRLGDMLPSVRTVSKDLGVSSTTVFDAYCRLEQIGLMTSRDRYGFRLAKVSNIPAMQLASAYFPPPISEVQINHYVSANDKMSHAVHLGNMSPPNNYFPSGELGKCLAEIALANNHEINSYGFSISSAKDILPIPIERITAKYMHHASGLLVSESEICHTNGATEALFIALSTITKKGDFVVVESPGFIGVYNELKRLYLEPIEIETLPPNGMNIDRLEDVLNTGIQPACIVVTPNFQNPTGSLMPLENRCRLIELCAKRNVTIIEDDTLGMLRFGDKIPTLKELLPDDVIYVNSYSKTMAPGYRVGWVAGGKYAHNIRIVQRLASYIMTLASHLAVAKFVETDKYRPYLRDLRAIYQKNCEKMRDAIKWAFPKETVVFRPQGGQYLWVVLPKSISANSLYFEALQQNIILAPGSLFTGQDKYANCLRFCFAMEITPRVFEAIETIGNIIEKQLPAG